MSVTVTAHQDALRSWFSNAHCLSPSSATGNATRDRYEYYLADFGWSLCARDERFLLSENRRPQATLAWLLVLFVAPSLGALIYDLAPRATRPQ
jgi:hypothetical protein